MGVVLDKQITDRPRLPRVAAAPRPERLPSPPGGTAGAGDGTCPESDRLRDLADQAVHWISEVCLLLPDGAPLSRSDRRIAVLLGALEDLARSVRSVGGPDDGEQAWIVGRDSLSVVHALDAESLYSACGLVGFATVENEDWSLARGSRCSRCERAAP
jgi:hypothetical protein